MARARVLELRLTHGVGETSPKFHWARPVRSSIHEAERALERASDDERIRGLVLEVSGPEIGWSKAQSLHRAIRAFRRRGKVTLGYLEGGGNAAYLMASACETLVLAKSTVLALHPLSSEALYFKDLLGELGIGPELDAVGEYKSAGEMFERRRASPAHREQLESILRDLEEQFEAGIAEARNMTPEEAHGAVVAGPYIGEQARARGLVDGVEHEDFCDAFLEKALGGPIKRVPHQRYAASGWLHRLWSWRRPRVALINAVGVLATGDTGAVGPVAVSARMLKELLTNARSNRKVRAVVLRVASPGGGAAASDIVHRELQRTAEKVPVIVSMGDVAASGGYYIATAAQKIFAEGTSLTGSIGVVGGKMVFRRLLDRLGVHRDTVSLGGKAGLFSPFRPFTEEERAWNRGHLEHFYRERFLPVVAQGRKMSLERADELGRGRVWTGRQALEAGLVDRLGGLGDAIREAREAAGLTPARSRVVVYGPRRRWRELLPFPLGGPFEDISLVRELFARWKLLAGLAREEILLLMPGWFRIR